MLRLSGTMRLERNYAISCGKPHSWKYQNWSGFFHCFSDPVSRAAWYRRGDYRRFRNDRLKRWLCDGDGAFRWRLQEFADDCGWARFRNTDVLCFQFTFVPGKYP